MTVHKTKKWSLIIAGAVVVGMVAVCSSLLIGLNWLWSQHRDIPLEELLIDVSALPDGFDVRAGPFRPSHSDGDIVAVDSRAIIFSAGSHSNTRVGARVYLNSNKWSAAAEYRDRIEVEFNSSSVASATSWQTPSAHPYQSSVASQSHFACHVSSIDQREVCKYFAQYDEYLVILTATPEPGILNYDDIVHLLKATDDLMAQRLSSGED